MLFYHSITICACLQGEFWLSFVIFFIFIISSFHTFLIFFSAAYFFHCHNTDCAANEITGRKCINFLYNLDLEYLYIPHMHKSYFHADFTQSRRRIDCVFLRTLFLPYSISFNSLSFLDICITIQNNGLMPIGMCFIFNIVLFYHRSSMRWFFKSLLRNKWKRERKRKKEKRKQEIMLRKVLSTLFLLRFCNGPVSFWLIHLIIIIWHTKVKISFKCDCTYIQAKFHYILFPLWLHMIHIESQKITSNHKVALNTC